MVFKIAIVGAGPAGCMLARLLTHRTNNIDVIVFEGEDHLNLRSQGGTLDLHVKTGQRALKEADLYDDFLRYARFDGEAMSLADKNLLRYLKHNGNSAKSTTGRPEIDRPKLRQILFESLPEDTVKWRHKLTQVEREEKTGEYTLHFEDQPPQTGFDLIVGADGAWSKVRPVLSATKPFYSGIAGHAFRIPDAEKTYPLGYDLANRGTLFTYGDSKSIMAQYMGDGSLSVTTWSRIPEDWRKECGYDVHDARATKEACLQEYADWDPRLVSLTQCAEDHVVPRDLYMLPVGHRWKHVQGITLIGDAAHLMGECDRDLSDRVNIHVLTVP
jgi:2-polyprenyl-6-methoxyphenol hydroxylase-like FAD-dependent oxidoreductase